ncbi:MAG TPA: hypothetical protein VFP85_03775 [Vicinamibacterales bacterium]|nr:hypothetical protein [Vicinamibacterales bacterium]
MTTAEIAKPLTRLFSELVDGIKERKGGYVLNTGDIGLLASLDRLSAAEASDSSNGGATIAAHAQHLRYGLSLMNRWIAEGGNPFADAKWDEAWMISEVDQAAWREIQMGLRDETQRWHQHLGTPREVDQVAATGLISSIAHFAYHMGAIRQISKTARGPREGTF